MKEYDWDQLKEIIQVSYDSKFCDQGLVLIIFTLIKKIEELEKNLHYRIDTVHERINNIRDNR